MTSTDLVVETTNGPVRGVSGVGLAGGGASWKGIRYAAPPVGELRWRSPRPPKRWTSVLDADRYGPVCPQPTEPSVPIELGAPQGEDCLSLNVWTPSGVAPGDRKPVMVWVHGGAYIFGAASQPLYDGTVLASGGDVVVVTLNYRLGAFGFLDPSSLDDGSWDTNVGLRDVLFALRWVQDNIAAFGGDPQQVTLFGESAGGGIVTTLLTSPAAAGLFSGAIAQSSPATSVYDIARAGRITAMLLERLGVGPSDLTRLRDVPTEALIAASKAVFEAVPVQSPGTVAFAPIVDGDIVPDHPVTLARAGRSHPVPLIIGTNKNEAALFKWLKSPLMPITPPAIKAMFADIAAERPDLELPTEAQIVSAYAGLRVKARGLGVARDVGFRMPSLWMAEGHSRVAPVYVYRFDWGTPMLKLLGISATHATELPYVFGNLTQGPKDPTFKLGGLKAGRTVSARMRARWLHFAATGKPAGLPDEPAWIPYQDTDRACLVIDRLDTVVNDIDADIRATWGDEVVSFR